MSKDEDLISLSMKNINKPLKHYKADAYGVFREVKYEINHNFQEYIENAEDGYIVSFFIKEMKLMSQKTALSEGLTIESPYVLLKNGQKIAIFDTKGLEMQVKDTWKSFFKYCQNPDGLEDFMADREQDTPRDIDL